MRAFISSWALLFLVTPGTCSRPLFSQSISNGTALTEPKLDLHDASKALIPKSEVACSGECKQKLDLWSTLKSSAGAAKTRIASQEFSDFLAALTGKLGDNGTIRESLGEHAWLVVYLGRHTIEAVMTRGESLGVTGTGFISFFKAILKKLLDAMARDVVFEYEGCASLREAATFAAIAKCAGNVVVMALNVFVTYAPKLVAKANEVGLPIDELWSPVLAMFLEVGTAVTDIINTGATGRNLWNLALVLLRMVVFVTITISTGSTTISWVADTSVCLLDSSLESWKEEALDSIKFTFSTGALAEKDMKQQLLPAGRQNWDSAMWSYAMYSTGEIGWDKTNWESAKYKTGRQCITRMCKALVRANPNKGLPQELTVDQLTSDDGETLVQAIQGESPFDLLMQRAHLVEIREDKVFVPYSEELVQRYKNWYKFASASEDPHIHAALKEDARNPATGPGSKEDPKMKNDCHVISERGGRCRLAENAAMAVCGNEKMTFGPMIGDRVSTADDGWFLPTTGGCFPVGQNGV